MEVLNPHKLEQFKMSIGTDNFDVDTYLQKHVRKKVNFQVFKDKKLFLKWTLNYVHVFPRNRHFFLLLS